MYSKWSYSALAMIPVDSKLSSTALLRNWKKNDRTRLSWQTDANSSSDSWNLQQKGTAASWMEFEGVGTRSVINSITSRKKIRDFRSIRTS